MKVAEEPPAQSFDPGPHYRVLSPLGEGAFGAVYSAVEVASGQAVALKVLSGVKAAALARFKREFRALCEVSHLNLVSLRELAEHGGTWFIAMELVEGTDLRSWVRPGTENDNGLAFNEPRLRQAFAGVAQGLAALHARGLLHRDLKPSNVRVTPAGRAVVLDFGFVTATAEASQSASGDIAGTAGYMAPEQATGQKVSPAADCYAFGSCLYEALTGERPFRDLSSLALLMRKAQEDPVPPRQLCPAVPAELDELCMRLLAREPTARAGLEEALRVLGGGAQTPAISGKSHELGSVFEGRSDELALLGQALTRTHEGKLSFAVVEGGSGIGKSALLSQLVREQLERAPQTYVLSGRCYEHERVPYKAFDGAIDALAKILGKLPFDVCAALLPRRAGVLAELFPVLRGVPALARAGLSGAPAEPAARRLEAFRILGSLLDKMAQDRPLIVLIDDLQWADQESLNLLRLLVEELRPPVLLVCAVRPDAELSSEVRAALSRLRKHPHSEWIELRGLSRKHAEAFVRRALGPECALRTIQQIALESHGHPMLMEELARYAKSHRGSALSLTLDAALFARIDALSVSARQLLEVLVVAERPHSEPFFERVCGSEDFTGALKSLLGERLARRNATFALVPAHDSVRKATLTRIDPTRLARLHRSLAQHLERLEQAEPSEIAFHWDAAHVPERAIPAYVRAAEDAQRSLAFQSAVDHYSRALELLGEGNAPDRTSLITARAHALAALGRSGDAAADYRRAAQSATSEEHIRLRVLAAQHQIQAVQFTAGMQSARSVLAELKVPLPEGTFGSALRLLWESARTSLRGSEVATRSDVRPEDKLALDAMYDLVLPVLWAEFLPGTALNAHHLRRSLELGERAHVARALAHEANLRALRGQHARGQELLRISERLANEAGDPATSAIVELIKGTATVLGGSQVAIGDLERAEHILVTSCPTETWLLTNTRMVLGSALASAGEHRKLAELARRWLAEGEARADPFAASALLSLGFGFIERLMRDAPEEVLGELERAIAPWREGEMGYAMFGDLVARSMTHAYSGSEQGWLWHEQHRKKHDKAILLRLGPPRDMFLFCRATAALVAYRSASEGEQARILRSARHDAKRLSREGYGPFLQLLACAQIEALAGQKERALELARSANELTFERGLWFFGHCAAYLRGTLEGGAKGKQLRDAALRFFGEQGWRVPWRAATICTPVARYLADQERPDESNTSSLFLGRYAPLGWEAQSSLHGLRSVHDTATGRNVTLFTLPCPSPDEVLRFKALFRSLQDLHHPNVARLEGLTEHDGNLTIALEGISETHFVSFSRPEGKLCEPALRNALRGLLEGLAAMHGAGCVHGQLRPEGVRIADDGRAVVLGPGLLAAAEGGLPSHFAELETLAYLAPEQIDGGPPDASSDVYAVGVCLYEALTGRLPLDQPTRAKLLEAKRRGRPVPPWALRVEVSPDVEELCLAMLERDPAERPSLAEARDQLDGKLDASARGRNRRKRMLYELSPHSGIWRLAQPAFTGRERELARIERHLAGSASGRAALFAVMGESGIGKTSLVAKAVTRQAEREPSTWVLRSRCYANVRLGHQAFDGAVEDLARALRELTASERSDLLPAQPALLAQLFPVLGTVPEIGGASKKGLVADPITRRALALDTFRVLLSRVSSAHPLIIVIDDLQWADLDSFTLLRQLLSDESALHVAILATARPAEGRAAAIDQGWAGLCQLACVQTLPLAPLEGADARALAETLLGPGAEARRIDAMVREANGHPLFMQELSSFAQRTAEVATFDLSQALMNRVQRLEAVARRALELLALSGRPCAVHVLERASRAGEHFDGALRELLREGLVERRGQLELGCFHDRLREVVCEHMEAELRRQRSAQLAEALDAASDADPAERARLWDAAGEPERAIEAYDQAGCVALSTLAFDAAERLYARALELCASASDKASLPRLLTQRAHALVALGCSAKAAPLFEQAAHLSEGATRLQLRVWAAQHQIQAAELKAGLDNAREVLRELGVPLPRGAASSIARILWERARIALRGYEVATKAEFSAQDKLALDSVQGLIIPVTTADFLPSQALNLYHLRRSLALGEPGHAARGLAQESVFHAISGDHAPCASLLEQSYRLARRAQEPAVLAFVEWADAATETFRGHVRKALPLLEASVERLATECAGNAWELMNVRGGLTGVLHLCGEYARFAREVSASLSEAEARGDKAALLHMLGFGCGVVAMLMRDEPDQAREALSRAMAPWRASSYGLAHFEEMIALWSIESYRGGAALWGWFSERRREHDRALIFKSGYPREQMLFYRASAALHAYSVAGTAERVTLLAAADADTRRLGRTEQGKLWQRQAQAQILALRGRVEEAAKLTREVRDGYAELGQLGFAHSLTFFLGLLDETEASSHESVLGWYRDQGWRDPRRAVTTWVPSARVLGDGAR